MTESPDGAIALDVATRFETARAGGHWAAAWALLSSRSRAGFGDLTAFIQSENAYNSAGGTTFLVNAPSQDPDLIANFLGASEAAIAADADMTRGWLVFISHPKVEGASAGSEGLFVAPLTSGEWRIWIVH